MLQAFRLFYKLHHLVFLTRNGKVAVFEEYVKLIVNESVENAFHTASERQRIVFVNVCFVVVQILVHVDKGATLKAYAVSVDKINETVVSAERVVGNYHNGVLALFVVGFYGFKDLYAMRQ